ncbi:class I SAM-dependent methyltransferase [Metapseudomonas furukawaii]|jgi:2-polyprenyl-3-methyl-5-hydroxy-6-metoxy-1,4-benzoquinol methylase|uniref:class I SAM-dependent methyltransferase n=1 Tax=Metapseudomonas furukawaii TaxID=1149133 RepID=UPI002113C2D0|nr:class I SAM-dependent methyltransferase [Pseudomonas sp. A46]
MNLLNDFWGGVRRGLCLLKSREPEANTETSGESPVRVGLNEPASADPEQWGKSQEYELSFWKEQWPYRHLSVAELQGNRHKDAMWFLGKMGFAKGETDFRFDGFDGEVLEVGCGPIGFFEKIDGIAVTAQDSLMKEYSEELPFSTLGKRGAATYVCVDVSELSGLFDFVVCSNVLDHTGDWIQFLSVCTKRLKKGGEFLLVTDSRGVPAEGHTQIFSHSQLIQVLELLGAQHFKVDAFQREDGVHCDYRHFIRAVF